LNALPQSPQELLDRLFTIFPEYHASYAGPIHDDAPSFRSVLIAFASEFSRSLASSPPRQLRELGTLASAAVDAGGDLANAFGTCLLEHLHQIGAKRALWPYLSPAARAATKA
jgi:hypothetical protein